MTRLDPQDAATYASWFACLAEPTRVRLLHAVATAGRAVTVGELTGELGISQSTCSHHVRRLADTGFVTLRRDGTATLVSINPDCCTGLPQAADAVMGMLGRPRPATGSPADLAVRPMLSQDGPAVRRIHAEGIATGHATFDTEPVSGVDDRWLPAHRWVVEVGGRIAGWAAVAPASTRSAYAGVGEHSVYVGDGFRGCGVGRALVEHLVTAADGGGIWTLQTAIFPENRASVALHLGTGFRTVGVRERVGWHRGVWRDTVLLERRRAAD